MASPGDSERPLRVLVMDHTAPVRVVRQRWTRLAGASDIDLTLLSPRRWIENSAQARFEANGWEGYRTVLGHASWPGNAMKYVYLTGLVRAFRRSRPDVVIMMEEPFSLVAVQTWIARLILAPRARTAFYACFITPVSEISFRPRPLFRLLTRVMRRSVSAGMCINDRATERLTAAGYPGARTNFFGVDETLFVPMSRQEARRELGLAAEERIFLYAGRLIYLKGVQDLIDAFSTLCASRPETTMRLIIIGAGDYGPSLFEQARRSPAAERIEFRASVPNEQIRTFMCAADAFVLPSRTDWHEQFGRVLAEAMLVGTPVIGSTSGEIPRVIEDGGYVFAADDPAALCAAMSAVLDDPAETGRRAERARRKALREYSVAAFVDRTIELIEELSGRTIRNGTAK